MSSSHCVSAGTITRPDKTTMFRALMLLISFGSLFCCGPAIPKRDVADLCRLTLFHHASNRTYNLTFNIFRRPKLVRQRFLDECAHSYSEDGRLGRISDARYNLKFLPDLHLMRNVFRIEFLFATPRTHTEVRLNAIKIPEHNKNIPGYLATIYNREDLQVRLLSGFYVNLQTNRHFNRVASVFGESFPVT